MKSKRSLATLVSALALVFVACQSQPDVPEADDPMDDETAGSQTEPVQLTGDALATALHDSDVFLLDVREPEELEEYGTVEGYTNIPIDELDGRLDELPRDRPILTA